MYPDAHAKSSILRLGSAKSVSGVGLDQKHHNYTVTAFTVTTLLYLAAGALFWYLQQHFLIADEVSRDQRITLRLSAFAPEPLLQDDLRQVERSRPKPLPSPPKERPVQEKPKPKRLEKKPMPKTQKRLSQPKPKPKKHLVQKKPAPKKSVKKYAVGSSTPHHAATKKNHFLAEVRERIDRHKHYPRIAKRRGMQGAVKVRFTILKNGSVGRILLSGSKLFYASARHAVQSAFPVETKGVPMALPAAVSLTLRYRLRE